MPARLPNSLGPITALVYLNFSRFAGTMALAVRTAAKGVFGRDPNVGMDHINSPVF